MARPSNRTERREQILRAFARVLANHGFAGSTIVRVAAEANLSPGLLHYHFSDKEELLSSLADSLVEKFRVQTKSHGATSDRLHQYADSALSINNGADPIVARCWVGLFGEAIRTPSLYRKFRRFIQSEIVRIEKMSEPRVSSHEASAILAFIIGSLVMGAFAPKRSAGFAAPALHRFIASMRPVSTRD